MCKHEPIPVSPADAEAIDRTDYLVDRMLANMSDVVFCTKCGKTGNYIKSHRGGIRWHSSSYFLVRANHIRQRHGLPLLTIK